MKPRFSILTLLGVTAYVAVNAAAVIYPGSNWRYATFLSWILTMLVATMFIAAPISRRSQTGTFSIGYVLSCLMYAVAAWAENDYPSKVGLKALGTFTPKMPHWFVMGWLLKLQRAEPLPNISNQLDAYYGLNLLALINTMMVAGFLGGCLALWYSRRQERKSQKS